MAKATTVSSATINDNGAWPTTDGTRYKAPLRALDWRKRMSDTVAYGLLVYTALQILVTVQVMNTASGSMLPLFALVVLVAAIIPLFRHYERHWERLDDQAAADMTLRPLFRRDQASIWLFAIGLPFAVTGLFEGFATLIG